MTKNDIVLFLDLFATRRNRTIVIIDYGNVEKWKNSLRWRVGIKELATLVKNFSQGKEFLRRFYYGSDYGHDNSSTVMIEWSRAILQKATMNRFEVITKRVKYIHDSSNQSGFEKKCDLDVEMTVDLIKEQNNYDTIVLFSGDGDLMYAIRYLKEYCQKSCIVFGARDHIGREIFDAKTAGTVEEIFYAEDFEYRLSKDRFIP
jgi:uncharacterized LabA/DUF88 family protein